MQEMFEQLMSAETEEDALEAEKFFLDKAKEAADADKCPYQPRTIWRNTGRQRNNSKEIHSLFVLGF